MSQTNFTPILLYASNTATSVPSAGNLTNSANGAEVAVNTADKRLFTKDSGGSVVELGTNPSSLSLPNQTANGVLYLNGSKVATSGSALTFDGTSKFELSINQNASTVVSASNTTSGTAAYAAYKLASDTVTWLYNFSSGYTTSGRFAAGTTLLDANGTGGLSLNANNGVTTFLIAGSEQMRLTSTGLGIGTSSPGTKLHVTGSNGLFVQFLNSQNNTGEGLVFGSGTNLGRMSTNGASTAMAFEINAVEKARLDASGNLGLGVTPSAWNAGKVMQFDTGGAFVFGDLSQFITGVNAYYQSGWKYTGTGAATKYETAYGQHRWFTAPSGTAGNAISFTQALTLHASGGMSLGNTTDPGATNLSVTGTITSGKGADVASASTVTLGAGNFFDITGTTTISAITIKPAGTVVYLKFDSSLTLQTGTIGSSGALRLTGGASLGVTQYDVLTLISDGTNWWQVAYNNN